MCCLQHSYSQTTVQFQHLDSRHCLISERCCRFRSEKAYQNVYVNDADFGFSFPLSCGTYQRPQKGLENGFQPYSDDEKCEKWKNSHLPIAKPLAVCGNPSSARMAIMKDGEWQKTSHATGRDGTAQQVSNDDASLVDLRLYLSSPFVEFLFLFLFFFLVFYEIYPKFP